MRQFIRHPVSIPITTEYADVAPAIYEASNVGIGGLTFSCQQEFKPGTILHLRIAHVVPAFETQARVVWCHRQGGVSELGVEFLSADDAFRARMVEQVCHIEAYKQQVNRTEGRTLSSKEAAAEWIGKFAPGFPNPGSD